MVKVTKTSIKDEVFRAILNDQKSLLVGVPESEAARGEDAQLLSGKVSVTNAYLVDLHTRGSDLTNLPPRPIIQPVLDKNSDYIEEVLRQVEVDKLEGKVESAESSLDRLGLFLQGEIRDWFENPSNGWAPNVPSTVLRKHGLVDAQDVPLVDTGALRNSLTYVIESESEVVGND